MWDSASVAVAPNNSSEKCHAPTDDTRPAFETRCLEGAAYRDCCSINAAPSLQTMERTQPDRAACGYCHESGHPENGKGQEGVHFNPLRSLGEQPPCPPFVR